MNFGGNMATEKNVRGSLTLGENFIYGLGAFGSGVSNAMVSTFILIYLVTIQGLNGYVLSVFFLLEKIWDGINDPMMAAVVNNTNLKHGKYRSWIAIGTLSNAVVLVLLFLPLGGATMGAKYAYYMVMYVLWGMTFTLVDVPFWSMIPSIADTTDDRNKLTSFARMINGFGGMLGMAGSAFVAHTWGATQAKSYFVLSAIFAVMFVGLMSVMLVKVKEKYPTPNEKIDFKGIVDVFKKNDQVWPYAISFLMFIIATGIAVGQIQSIFLYDTKRLAFDLMIVYTILSSTGQGLVMIFYPWIARKIPREKMYAASYIMAIVGLALIFVMFLFMGTNVILNIVMMSLAASLMTIGNGINQIGSTVMITDVVDYGEYKTGKRNDSLIISVQTFIGKLSGAASLFIISIATEVSGLPKIDPITNSFDGVVTDQMLLIFRVFMFLLPIPLLVIGYIVYKKKYKLVGKKYDEMKESLIEKHEAEALLGGVSSASVQNPVEGQITKE